MPTLTAVLWETALIKSDSEIQNLISQIESLRIACEDLSVEHWNVGLQRLAPMRIRSSGTLKKGDLEPWVQANNFISDSIRSQNKIDWSEILKINSILTGRPVPELIRTQDIYLGAWSAAPFADLPEMIERYTQKNLSPVSDNHILVTAALAHYSLVSIHPFWDANGRTSVMTADWILTKNGFLPQSFESQRDAMVGYLEGKLATASPAKAVLKILRNVQRSYLTVLAAQRRSKT